MFTYLFAYANPPEYTGVATNMNIEAVIHSEIFDNNPNIDIITPDNDDEIIKIFIKFWIDTQLSNAMSTSFETKDMPWMTILSKDASSLVKYLLSVAIVYKKFSKPSITISIKKKYKMKTAQHKITDNRDPVPVTGLCDSLTLSTERFKLQSEVSKL